MGIGISKCDTPYYAKQARFDREECEISSSDYLGKVTMSAIEHFIQGLLLTDDYEEEYDDIIQINIKDTDSYISQCPVPQTIFRDNLRDVVTRKILKSNL